MLQVSLVFFYLIKWCNPSSIDAKQDYGVTNARRWSVSLRYKSYTTALGCFRQTTRVYYNSKEVRNYIILTKIQKCFKNIYFQSISCLHYRIFNRHLKYLFRIFFTIDTSIGSSCPNRKYIIEFKTIHQIKIRFRMFKISKMFKFRFF